MNKKKIIYYSCVIFFMLIIGVIVPIIINSISAKYETEESRALKEILIAFDENTKSTKKGLEIKFVQDVEYVDIDDNDEEGVNYNAHYRSNGSFILSVENKDSKNVELENGFQSFFENGNGFIACDQSETYIISNEEKDKSTNTVIKNESHDYTIANKTIIDSDTNLSILSQTSYRNNGVDSLDNFYGKIDKNVLLTAIDVESFDEAINQMMFIDFWGNVSSLLSLMHTSFKAIDYNNYKQIYDYISNKNFNFEKNDNVINVNFEFDLDDSFKEENNNFKNVLVNIKINTITKEIEYFKFDLSNYYSSIIIADSPDSPNLTSKLNKYYFEGKIINNTIERVVGPNVTYTEYNEDTKYDFIDGFIGHAIPVHEDIY